jgi:predicted metal-dependent enzyme (double-stranded beta helix superfamily)
MAMSKGGEVYTTRESSRAVIAAIERFDRDHDNQALRDGLLKATQGLIARPDLLKLGTKRQANHIDNSKYLYFDGQVSMTLDQFPKGKLIPPHDHGIWEALVVCRGRLRHTVYERADDGTIEGYADLRVVEDCELKPGEVTMVVPPAEIHSFQAQADETYVITIVGGEYSPLRHYYQVEEKTYITRTPAALQQTRPLNT